MYELLETEEGVAKGKELELTLAKADVGKIRLTLDDVRKATPIYPIALSVTAREWLTAVINDPAYSIIDARSDVDMLISAVTQRETTVLTITLRRDVEST